MPLFLVRGEQRVFAAWTVEAETAEEAADKVKTGEADVGEPELDDEYVEVLGVEPILGVAVPE